MYKVEVRRKDYYNINEFKNYREAIVYFNEALKYVRYNEEEQITLINIVCRTLVIEIARFEFKGCNYGC